MQLSRFSLATVTLAALILTAPAFAQDRGGRGGRGGGFGRGFGGFGGGRGMDKTMLLRSDQVREELKVTEEQGTKVDEILASYREASRGGFEGFPGRDAAEEEIAKWREEREKQTAALLKETSKKLDEVLTKEQNWRLNEIVLQQQGIDGLVSERVVAALELSEEQVGKIKASLEDRDTKLRELGGFGRRRRGGGDEGGDRPNFEEIREKMTALRTDAEKSVMAVLSDKQKEGYAKLKGAEFELDRRALFGGGRGGARGGRGGDAEGGARRRPGGDAEGGEGGGRRRPRPESDEL